jgi:hypothetical protein
LEIHVGPPGKQQKLRVLVDPRVIVFRRKVFAFVSAGVFDKGKRSGTDGEREVEATGAVLVALQREAALLTMDDAAVFLAAVAEIAVDTFNVPGRTGGQVEKIEKEAVPRPTRANRVRVECSDEVGEVVYDTLVVVMACPVDNIDMNSILQP